MVFIILASKNILLPFLHNEIKTYKNRSYDKWRYVCPPKKTACLIDSRVVCITFLYLSHSLLFLLKRFPSFDFAAQIQLTALKPLIYKHLVFAAKIFFFLLFMQRIYFVSFSVSHKNRPCSIYCSKVFDLKHKIWISRRLNGRGKRLIFLWKRKKGKSTNTNKIISWEEDGRKEPFELVSKFICIFCIFAEGYIYWL